MFGFCLQFLSFQISKPKSYQLCEDAPSPMLLAKCFLPQEAFFSLTFSEAATFSLPQPSSHCLLHLRLGTQTTGWVLFCSVSRWGGGIITFQIGVKRSYIKQYSLKLDWLFLYLNFLLILQIVVQAYCSNLYSHPLYLRECIQFSSVAQRVYCTPPITKLFHLYQYKLSCFCF